MGMLDAIPIVFAVLQKALQETPKEMSRRVSEKL